MNQQPCNLVREVVRREYDSEGIPWNQSLLESWEGEVRLLKVRSGEPRVPLLGPTHYVGLIPFKCGTSGCTQGHVLVILPKGTPKDKGEYDSLWRFSELLMLTSGLEAGEPPADMLGWKGKREASIGTRFVLLLAVYYALLVRDLCLRDFRRYYRLEESELLGRIRGRPHVLGHIRNAVRGRAHIIPCRWEEFTPDNWDNRILDGAARALESSAALLGGVAGRGMVRALFRKVEPYFTLVEDVPVTGADFFRAKLHRVSIYYRRALAWASLILRGIERPRAGGRAPKITFDTHKVFEEFARLTVKESLAKSGLPLTLSPKKGVGKLLSSDRVTEGSLLPDVVVTTERDKTEIIAIGDAKYKRVLELVDASSSQEDKAAEPIPLEHVAQLCVSPQCADLYQLYVYMRWAQAPLGFFVVPYWQEDGEAAAIYPSNEKPLRFNKSPLDGLKGRNDNDHAIIVLGLNMMKRPSEAKKQGAELLSQWLVRKLGK